jgi:hypothetical protein
MTRFCFGACFCSASAATISWKHRFRCDDIMEASWKHHGNIMEAQLLIGIMEAQLITTLIESLI